MTAVKKKEWLEIDRWMARYYALLSEWFIGVYPDSRSLSIGPFNHAELGEKVLEAHNMLLSLKGLGVETSKTIRMDYERVSKMLPKLESHLEDTDDRNNARALNLEKYDHEREYLTKLALEHNSIFSKQ